MKNRLALLLMTLIVMGLIAPVFAWEMERPSYYVQIGERAENAYAEEAAVGIGVEIHNYYEEDPIFSYEGKNRDGIFLRVVGTANTRCSIEYTCDLYDYEMIPRGLLPFTLNLGDDDAKSVDLPFNVLFYSGPGLQNNSIYKKDSAVWINSNGFICFDDGYPTAHPPSGIGDPAPPNTIIAPYWSDLDPSGGVIRYGSTSYLGVFYYGVEWDNVLDKNNSARQTFAVFIQHDPYQTRNQNWITFEYYNVTWSSNAIWGIEDQEGYKGTGGKGPVSAKSVLLSPWDMPAEIRKMSITVEKKDSCAAVRFGTDEYELAGSNLKWKDTAPAPNPWYYVALKGTATLLTSKFLLPAVGLTGSGLLFGTLLLSGAVLAYDVLDAYSRSLWKPDEVEKIDANTTQNIAYVKVPAAGSGESDYPVDAELSATLYWIFTDDNTESHSITITTQVTYYSLADNQLYTVPTSVEITVVRDAGNSLSTARAVTPGTYLAFVGQAVPSPGFDDFDDYYKLNVGEGMDLHLTMKPHNNTNFDLYLYDPSGRMVRSSQKGTNITEEIYYTTTVAGNWFIRVNAFDGLGIYTLTIDEPHPINASSVGLSSIVENSVTTLSCQRKPFYANGRHWVFYAESTAKIVCKSSTDGINWALVPNGNISISGGGYTFSIYFDETYLHYAYSSGQPNQPLKYRRGIPNADGTFTWSADEQTAVAAASYTSYKYPTISANSTRHPFIAYQYEYYKSGPMPIQIYKTMVTASSRNDGVWSTASGFPYALESQYGYQPVIICLTGGKMYAVYGGAFSILKGRLWTPGIGWNQTEENVTSSPVYGNYFSVTNESDNVHVTFLTTNQHNITHVKRTSGSGWSSETTVHANASATLGAPVLSIHNTTLYCFWSQNTNIYFKTRSNSVWDQTPILLVKNETNLAGLTCFYQSGGNTIGIEWTRRADPYNPPWTSQVRYAKINA